MRRQNHIKSHSAVPMPAECWLNSQALNKEGNDAIFSWYAKYKNAVLEGHAAINATVGSLLEDDGNLAINRAALNAVKASEDVEFASYAPLKGLPSYLDLSISLALGHERSNLENLGFHMTSIATPGGSGALYLTAANLIENGQKVLLRDRHWAPYAGFIAGCNLKMQTWPLLPSSSSKTPFFDHSGFEESLQSLREEQSKILVWLNDPAHNPTGLSMTPSGRRACLESMVTSALSSENVGHTLVIDAAYAMYAEESHGWAETIRKAIEEGMPWPENLLVCFAVSLSKSHTVYGLRTGALVSIHPEVEVVNRLETVFGVTGRSTWSAAPRVAQHAMSMLHANEEAGSHWSSERDRLKMMLDERRNTLLESCQNYGIGLNPTHDGFFAWLECKDSVEIATQCAKFHVYVVPLEHGIRIGLCSLRASDCDHFASVLSQFIG